jgi:Thioredoxin
LLAAAWRRSRWLLALAALATASSVALLGVELFVIGSVCLLCEGVHVACAVLLVLAWQNRQSNVGPLRELEGSLLIFGPALGLLLAAALFQRPYWGVFAWRGDLPFAQGKTEDGYPWIGAEQPAIVVQEFTDYSCPHCKAASSHLLRVLAERPKTLRVVRRQFARLPCPSGVSTSCQMVRVAYCAQEQGKFWQADRWLFEHGTGRSQVDLGEAARDIGLDAERLRGCIERDDTYRRAEAEARLARKKSIPGTPYYIVGNELLAPQQLLSRLAKP